LPVSAWRSEDGVTVEWLGGVEGGVGTTRSRIHADLGNGFARGDFERNGTRDCCGTTGAAGRISELRHPASMTIASRAALQRAGGDGGGLYIGCASSRCSVWKVS
jgi:hypothetical protein